MEFPVVSTRGRPQVCFTGQLWDCAHKLQLRIEGNLELEVMSRAPLFGHLDSRLRPPWPEVLFFRVVAKPFRAVTTSSEVATRG